MAISIMIDMEEVLTIKNYLQIFDLIVFILTICRIIWTLWVQPFFNTWSVYSESRYEHDI